MARKLKGYPHRREPPGIGGLMMRLLIATDGSPHARRAVELGARLARELRDAEIVLINVGHIPAVAFAAPLDMGYVDLTPLEEALEQDGKKFLEEATKAFAGFKAPVSGLYRRGDRKSVV